MMDAPDDPVRPPRMTTGDMLREQADKSAWKTWVLISAVVTGSFMAGMNMTGLMHALDHGAHITEEDVQALETIRLRINALEIQAGVPQLSIVEMDRRHKDRIEEIDRRINRISTAKFGSRSDVGADQ